MWLVNNIALEFLSVCLRMWPSVICVAYRDSFQLLSLKECCLIVYEMSVIIGFVFKLLQSLVSLQFSYS